MANLSGKPRAEYVKRMFSRLASRYDRANRWMTWRQDLKWRRKVLDLSALPLGGWLLDLGTGTGDLALEAHRRDPSAHVVGLDFTHEMMQQALNRPGSTDVHWVTADALEIPFYPGIFDAIVSGFLLRNVIDVGRTLGEQYRVLKPGGHLVCLDTTPLPGDIWHLPERIYTSLVVPMIGALVAGDAKAYTYLPASTSRFLTADQLAGLMLKVGYTDIRYRKFMGGSVVIHWGIK